MLDLNDLICAAEINLVLTNDIAAAQSLDADLIGISFLIIC